MYNALTKEQVRQLQQSALGRKFLREYAKAETFLQKAAKVTKVKTRIEDISIKRTQNYNFLAHPATVPGKGLVYKPDVKLINKEIKRLKKIGGGNPDNQSTRVLRKALQGYAVVYTNGIQQYIPLSTRENYIKKSEKATTKLKAEIRKQTKLSENEINEVVKSIIPPVEVIGTYETAKRTMNRMSQEMKPYLPAKFLERPSKFWERAQKEGYSTHSPNYVINNYMKVIKTISNQGEEGRRIAARFKRALSNPKLGYTFITWSQNIRHADQNLYEKIWDSKNEQRGTWANVIAAIKELLEEIGEPKDPKDL